MSCANVSDSLKLKTIRSGFWSIGGNWVSKGLGIIKLIILARLLSPLDFGIISLAVLSINFLNVFSETGIESALIQRGKINNIELDTAWTIALVKAIILFVLLFLSSEWLALYFENETIRPVLKVISFSFLFEGLGNTAIVFFKKDLEFRKPVILEFIADSSSLIVTIVLAFWLRNVWSLVFGSLVYGIVRCIGSYILHPYRPKFTWNLPVANSLFNFGKHIYWIGLTTFIVTCLDNAIVGKLLGLTLLGFYSMAYNLSMIPMSSLSTVIAQISFPAYAKIQHEWKQIDEAFQRIFELVTTILIPLTIMMVVLAPDITTIFLGISWIPMIPALQVLLFFGLFRSISSLFYPLHLAINKPNIQAKIKSLDLVTFLILIYPLTIKWGIVGTSCAMTIVYLLNMLMNIAFTLHTVPLDWRRLGVSLIVPCAISFALIATSFLIRSLSLPIGNTANFIVIVVSCLGVGTLLVIIFRRSLLYDLISSMKSV